MTTPVELGHWRASVGEAIIAIVGLISTVIGLLIRNYLSTPVIDRATADRVKQLEVAANELRAKRLGEVKNEASRTTDAAAALDLLRRQFPSRVKT